MIVVSDTTPLISLMKASKLIALKYLYNEVLIPQAVYSELVSNRLFQSEAEEIGNCSFIRIVSVTNTVSVEEFRQNTGLDLGESEAILYAEENRADILLIDEDAGRRVARSMGIHIQGTIGILLSAFDRDILSAEDVKDAIEKLKRTHRHISESIYQYALNYIESQK